MLYKFNIVVKVYAVNTIPHLLSIREVPGSSLGPETGYPDRLSVVFISTSRKMPITLN
jgi:hypothetical protein